MALLAISAQSQLHLTLAVLVVGVIVGIIGHLGRWPWLVLLGILIVGADVALFSFVLRPGSS
jgi:uncharacterized membrane protein YGL010W